MSRGDAHRAAAALLKLSKKVQNGTATETDAAAVPPGWRGYLVPRASEQPGPNGERLLTDLLTDLRTAVVAVVAPMSPVVALDGPTPSWISALVVASHVWTAPVQAGGGGAGAAPARKDDDLARARLAAALPRRPHDGDVRVPFVVLLDLEEALDASLREIAATLESMRPKRTWDELVGLRSSASPAPVPDLFQVVLVVAGERFTAVGGTPGPVVACLKRAIDTGALLGAGLCEPARCRGPGTCACRRWLSTQGPTSRQPGREARRGLIALRIAAWQLAANVVEVAPAPVAVPLRTARSRLGSDELSAVGALLTLHGRRFQAWHVEEGDVGVLLRAAAELDAMEHRPTLAVVAEITARVVWATARVWTDPHVRTARTPALDHAVAQLARSTAGAFRELRRPHAVIAALAPLEQAFDASPEAMKIHEARQDVQLAFQRVGLWTPAAASFDLAKQKMELFVEDYRSTRVDEEGMLRQKVEEVTEQLLLGRVGGLVQEVEARVCAGEGDAAGDALASARVGVDLLLTQLHVLQLEHFRAADRPGPPGYLRYDEPWAVMPTLMRYRIAVAGVLVAHCEQREYAHGKAARAQVRRARGEAVGLQGSFTDRHRWEMQRIDVVAALWEDELDFEAAVADVVAAGGDDGVGDYVLPVLRWAATMPLFRDRVTGPALVLAIDLLSAADASSAPRLPDLLALGPTQA